MSTSTTTYNVIIKRFEDFATAHPLINRFTYGTIQEGDIGKSCTYPWMHVAPSSTNYDEGQRGMSFDILFADLVRDKDDKPENEKEIISDCSQLFEDLLATIENNTLFGDNALLQKPITITPFLNSFTNNLTGVEGTVTIELDYTFDFCSVPVDFNLNIPTSGGQGSGGVLTFDDSLNLSGTSVTLDNDVDTPGNDYYYGTDATGTKGWYTLPTGGPPTGAAGGGGSPNKWQHQKLHASQVTNDSQVTGTNVSDALNHLDTKLTSQLWNFQNAAAIAASTTTWIGVGLTSGGNESSSTVIIPHAMSLKNMYLMHYSTNQPASGAQVITVRKNGADTSLAITIAAGAVTSSTPYSNTAHTISFVAGDKLSIRRVNNATASGGVFNGISFSMVV